MVMNNDRVGRIRLKAGLLLIAASYPLGYVGLFGGAAMAARTGVARWLAVGVAMYVLSWLIFGLGLVLAGSEGWRYVKRWRSRCLRTARRANTQAPTDSSADDHKELTRRNQIENGRR